MPFAALLASHGLEGEGGGGGEGEGSLLDCARGEAVPSAELQDL